MPLYVPAHDGRKVEKALAGTADGVILDLEDGVPASERDAARQVVTELVAAALPVLVRVNAVDTSDHELDLAAVRSTPHVAGIVLPKATVDAVNGVATDLPVFPLIETAAGLESLGGRLDARVTALLLGAGDFLADIDGRWTDDELPLLYARGRMVAAAAAAGIPAIDTPDPEFRDTALVEARARRVRELGFAGKAAIHPAQVDAIRRGLAPTSEEIAWAEAVRSRSKGGGAWAADGEVEDAATLRRAERILKGLP